MKTISECLRYLQHLTCSDVIYRPSSCQIFLLTDTIAPVSYCFVCKRNEICKMSYKEGLCHDCFNAKYDVKLCVVCNKKNYKGGLCKGCNMKQGNEIKTKKCMACNRNQARCKGGLCRGCYKKQGRDGTK